MICLECCSGMVMVREDLYRCPSCGFEAEQLKIERIILMTEGAGSSETLKRIVESIGKVFSKLWKVVKAFVRKLTRALILACRHVPSLETNVRIYLRTKNKRIMRKQQKIIFTTMVRLIL